MPRTYAYRKPWLRLLAQGFDFLGDRLLSRHRPGRPSLEDALVLRLDQLGDVVLSLPFFDALFDDDPARKVRVLTTPAGAAVLRGHPVIGQLDTWSCPWFTGEKLSLAAFRWLVAYLREGGFGTAVDLRGDLRITLALRAAGVPEAVGYGLTGGGFLLTCEVPWEPGLHAADRGLEVARAMGLDAPGPGVPRLDPRRPLPPPPAACPEGPFLAVHPQAGTPAKTWPEAHFVELLRGLRAARPELELVLVGIDRALGERLVAAGGPGGVTNLMGATSLEELQAVLRASRGLVTGDSGPAHLAAALHRRVWVLWSGAAPPEGWIPRGEKVWIFRSPVPCAPCWSSTCKVPGHPCLRELRPEPVVAQLAADLGR